MSLFYPADLVVQKVSWISSESYRCVVICRLRWEEIAMAAAAAEPERPWHIRVVDGMDEQRSDEMEAWKL